jgi:hypothetical protein
MFPFNTYDVFGYLIPGAVFGLFSFLTEFWMKSTFQIEHAPIFTLLELFVDIDSSTSTMRAITFLLIILIILYFFGHLIATISSLYIDRTLIRKGYNYPIIGLMTNMVYHEDHHAKTIRSNFVVLNAALCIYILLLLFPALFNLRSVCEEVVLHILGSFFLIVFFFGLSMSFTNARSLFWMKSSRTRNFFSNIYTRISNILGRIVGTSDQMSSEIIEKYKRFIKYELKLDPNSGSSEIYWLSYIYIIRNSESLNGLILNWLHLYSFARNVATSMFSCLIYISLLLTVNTHSGSGIQNWPRVEALILIAILSFVYMSSILFLIRYYYLYYSYYSKFIIRSCVHLFNEDSD